MATIEKQDGDLSQEYPCSARMIEARKATFADRWPHESKKGWKCKIKQVELNFYLNRTTLIAFTVGRRGMEIYTNSRI